MLIHPQSALPIAGQWGVAFGIDAPWRLEPIPTGTGYTYGAIPITITFRQAISEMGRMNYTVDGTGAGIDVGLIVGALTNPLVGLFAGYETEKNLSGNVGDRIRRGLFNAGNSIWVGAVTVVKVEEITGIHNAPNAPDRWYEGPRTYIRPAQFREVERKRQFYSTLNNEPQHQICRPFLGETCSSSMFEITDTDEWHGLFWYTPQTPVTPGRNIQLKVTVVTQNTDGSDGHRWVGLLVVHAGEAPLPRFGANWLHGDLHYHSQMTANEGEYGYSYRNVARTLGVLGLDYVFATDHASNSEQALSRIFTGRCGDAPDAFICTPSSSPRLCPGTNLTCKAYLPGKLARDLNTSKFTMAKTFIYGSDGTTQAAARDAQFGFGRLRSANVLPQVYMGEEVDVQPEMSAKEQQDGVIYYGDGLKYWWVNDDDPSLLAENNLFGIQCIMDQYYKRHGSYPRPTPEPPDDPKTGELRTIIDFCRNLHSEPYAPRDQRSFIVKDTEGPGGSERGAAAAADATLGVLGGALTKGLIKVTEGFLLREDQADAEAVITPAREHLVYLPLDTSLSSKGFIASNTTRFGGAGKRLEDVLHEIEGNQSYAFLAHPLANSAPGGPGPDIPPYPDIALNRAWSSPAILGLQFWNEDYHRFANSPSGTGTSMMQDGEKLMCLGIRCAPDITVGNGGKPIEGYVSHELWGPFHIKGNVAGTSYNSQAYLPWRWPQYQSVPENLDLYDGAFTWDRYLRKGLSPAETASLPWLAKGQPRKWFMAGGNDAHGDFNYRQNGQMTPFQRWGTTQILDTAIGRVHNMAHVRDSQTEVPGFPSMVRYSNQQVIHALASGEFAVTNGPVIRIAIDKNRDGQIDDGDFQMGSTFNLFPGEQIPLLVEWMSTKEFGPIAAVDIYVGNPAHTFAPKQHGPAIPIRFLPRTGQEFGGPNPDYANYQPDPSGVLKIQLADVPGVTPELRFHGLVQVMLSPSSFQLSTPDQLLFYIRAVAKTRLGPDAARAGECPDPLLAGSSCGDRFAYANPVWGRFNMVCPVKQSPPIGKTSPGIVGQVLLPGMLGYLDADNNGVPDICERIIPDPCPAPTGVKGSAALGLNLQATFATVEPASTTGVVIYENASFGGRSKTLGVGTHSLTDFNDIASSIRVPPGLVAILYDQVDAGGGYGVSVDLMEDRPDLATINFNDKLSYITVFSSPNSQGLVWTRNSLQSGQFVAGHWERPRAGGSPVNTVAVISPPLPAHAVAPTTPVNPTGQLTAPHSCQLPVKSVMYLAPGSTVLPPGPGTLAPPTATPQPAPGAAPKLLTPMQIRPRGVEGNEPAQAQPEALEGAPAMEPQLSPPAAP
jgi:hypothetical protein